MRVYEFARNFNMESKEIVKVCQELGIAVKAQSKLDENQLGLLSQHFSNGKDTAEMMPSTPKVVKKTKTDKKEKAIKAEKKVKSDKLVAYVVTECEPFTTLGSLGTVANQFATHSNESGKASIIVLPKYKVITEAYGEKMDWVMDLPVRVGWRDVRASIFKMVEGTVTYLFIGNDHYFTRENIYGYEDDVERFAFFNRSVIEVLPHLNFKVTEIQTNDWHTSMIPLILNVDYANHPFYQKVKTTLNIHSLEYQGWYDASILTDVLGISRKYYENGLTRMGDSVNLLKSGIETATRIQLTELSSEQLHLPQMQECGITSVIENKLDVKVS